LVSLSFAGTVGAADAGKNDIWFAFSDMNTPLFGLLWFGLAQRFRLWRMGVVRHWVWARHKSADPVGPG